MCPPTQQNRDRNPPADHLTTTAGPFLYRPVPETAPETHLCRSPRTSDPLRDSPKESEETHSQAFLKTHGAHSVATAPRCPAVGKLSEARTLTDLLWVERPSVCCRRVHGILLVVVRPAGRREAESQLSPPKPDPPAPQVNSTPTSPLASVLLGR